MTSPDFRLLPHTASALLMIWFCNVNRLQLFTCAAVCSETVCGVEELPLLSFVRQEVFVLQVVFLVGKTRIEVLTIHDGTHFGNTSKVTQPPARATDEQKQAE